MARLLSRAYERLNKILSLAGSQVVNDIDLGTAFAVHDLTPIVAAEAISPYLLGVTVTIGAAATTTADLDPFDIGDWDLVRRGPVAGDELIADRNNEAVLITDLSAFGDVADISFARFLWTISGPGGTVLRNLTLDMDTGGAGGQLLPGAPTGTTQDYYGPSMGSGPPFFAWPHGRTLGCRIQGNGGGDVDLIVQGFVGPIGAFRGFPG